MGRGAVSTHSIKQKINTRSSTEAELVAVDDMAGLILWTTSFLKGHGYTNDSTIVYQDNKSAILLEKNGVWSCGKRSKHISVRYFFIKDRVDKGELSIDWCSASEMVADYFTKPLQGRLFFKFRQLIMNTSS